MPDVYCPECDFLNDEDALTCRACGEPLVDFFEPDDYDELERHGDPLSAYELRVNRGVYD